MKGLCGIAGLGDEPDGKDILTRPGGCTHDLSRVVNNRQSRRQLRAGRNSERKRRFTNSSKRDAVGVAGLPVGKLRWCGNLSKPFRTGLTKGRQRNQKSKQQRYHCYGFHVKPNHPFRNNHSPYRGAGASLSAWCRALWGAGEDMSNAT